MDVIDLPKCKLSYRLLYDVKGRFKFIKINKKESGFKLCRIQKKAIGPNKIGYLVTHDGRTLRYADPNIKIHDTVRLNLIENRVEEFYQFEVGQLAYASHGNNRGRIGVITSIIKFEGNFDLVTIKDSKGNTFTTRITYVFVIGNGDKSAISLPRGNGVKLTIMEDLENKEQNKN